MYTSNILSFVLSSSIVLGSPIIYDQVGLNAVSTTVECVTLTLQNEITTEVFPTVTQNVETLSYKENCTDPIVVNEIITSVDYSYSVQTVVVEEVVTTECETFEVANTFTFASESVETPCVDIVTDEVVVADLSTTTVYQTPTETVMDDVEVADVTSSVCETPTETVMDDVEVADVTSSVCEIPTETVMDDVDTTTTLSSDESVGFPAEPTDVPDIDIVEIDDDVVLDVRTVGEDFCNAVGLGNVIGNGTQQQFETCSITVQGAIPSTDNMVSTMITEPLNGEEFPLGVNITVIIKSINIEYGFFDDPSTLYYISPQRLNESGNIKGHNHVALQRILSNDEVPDPKTPVFFKGLNEVSEDGVLSVTIPGDSITEVGVYRICTATSSQSHAPVLMPVARRGFSDDCIRIVVV